MKSGRPSIFLSLWEKAHQQEAEVGHNPKVAEYLCCTASLSQRSAATVNCVKNSKIQFFFTVKSIRYGA
jgi:hypothetical protein